LSEEGSIWVFIQRPSIISLDATYRRVCVVKESNNCQIIRLERFSDIVLKKDFVT
jgi:hypothetical protein